MLIRSTTPTVGLMLLSLLWAAPRVADGQEASAADEDSREPGSALATNENEDETKPGQDATAEETPRDPTWSERIVVTATRSAQEVGEIPLHVKVIDREQIEMAPEIGLRDVFLRVPSITLASGEGTLTAGPVDGGIAFRGLGGTAQSRALVLVDGLPVNDPFGSYLLWARIPEDTIERIEIVPGAGGSWGNLALSGVVNMITVSATDRAVSAKLQAGEYSTREATLLYSDVSEHWSGWVSGTALDSDGYVTLEPSLRRPIDEPSRTQYQTWSGKLSRAFTESVALHLGATIYDENRHRGTRFTTDDSNENALNGTLDLAGGAGSWQLRFFGRDVGLEEATGLANSARSSETLNATLDAPSESWGASAVWFGAGNPKHSLTAGTDLLLTAVESTAAFDVVAGSFTKRVFTEGEQQFAGVFAQDLFEPSPRVTLLYGARFDALSTADGRRLETDLVTGQQTETILIDRNTETTLNPSAGIVYEASTTTRLRSSVYTGFRAATASELFVDAIGRSKNVANSRLEPERLIGAEVGVDFTPSRRLATRATGYWSEVEDLIDRILLGRGGPGGNVIPPCGFVPQNASCRERQNIGKVRAVGLEIEQEVRLPPHWRLELSGALLETEVTENRANPAFVGNGVQQMPERAGSLSLTYDNPRYLSALARASYVGDRWNDAANELLLEARLLVDLSVSRAVGAHWGVFAGVTNLLDEEYPVEILTDGADLGAPRMAHAGIRFALR